MRAARVIAAFAIAPAAGIVTFALLLIATDRRVQPWGVLAVASILAYAATLLLGVPAWFVSRRWQWRSPATFIATSIGIAAIPTIAVAVMAGNILLIPLAFIGAAVTGWCFWALTVRTPAAASS